MVLRNEQENSAFFVGIGRAWAIFGIGTEGALDLWKLVQTTRILKYVSPTGLIKYQSDPAGSIHGTW
jgi:hypothetical protein